MPLEGLRAWIGEVERKLGMRTRVFLVLVVIAVGGAGAAIYLAIDARESSVSESDVQALQEKLETRIAEGGAAAPVAPEEEAPVEPEPAPEGEPKSGEGAKNGAAGDGASTEGTGSESGGAAAPSGADSAKFKELVEQAEKQR
jgi:hypothetical protein